VLGKLDRITINPAVMNGQPCIRGMRLTVRRVLEAVALYPDPTELKVQYPELEDEDIAQALAFAARNLDGQILPWERRDPTATRPRGCHASRSGCWVQTGGTQFMPLNTVSIPRATSKYWNTPRGGNRIICSLDADFPSMLAVTRAARPSVYSHPAAGTTRRCGCLAVKRAAGKLEHVSKAGGCDGYRARWLATLSP
jgi:uncharacterized protein (DUF433 family)